MFCYSHSNRVLTASPRNDPVQPFLDKRETIVDVNKTLEEKSEAEVHVVTENTEHSGGF